MDSAPVSIALKKAVHFFAFGATKIDVFECPIHLKLAP